MFPADTTYATVMPSPNCESREGHAVDMLVLHYTGMKSAAAAMDKLIDPASKVSAHYVIDELGGVFQLVPEAMRAWHAGKSYWRGHTNINQRSIGIEIVNPGHEFGYRPFPEIQMQRVIALCKEILGRHAIPSEHVVGHSDIAPSRKMDPGELFDWQRLAAAGIGWWPSPCNHQEVSGGHKALDAAFLANIGYDTSDLPAAIRAFRRRFTPSEMVAA